MTDIHACHTPTYKYVPVENEDADVQQCNAKGAAASYHTLLTHTGTCILYIIIIIVLIFGVIAV